MKKKITTRVKQIIKSHFLINIRKPIAQANLFQDRDVQFSPMEFLEMIFYVENEFGIELMDSDISQIQTVADLVRCVEKYADEATPADKERFHHSMLQQ